MTADMPHIPAAAVTILDVYTKQVELGGQLDLINERLKQLPDHEARIRVLESARAKMFGAAVAVSCVVSAGGTWAGIVITHHLPDFAAAAWPAWNPS
jgi:hypothetical protein